MWCHLLLLLPLIGLGLFVILPLPIALPAYLALVAISLVVYRATLQAMHRPVVTGKGGMVGATAVAETDLSPTGWVRYRGELWQAVADAPIPAGSRVTIEAVERMRVRVKRLGKPLSTAPDLNKQYSTLAYLQENVRGQKEVRTGDDG